MQQEARRKADQSGKHFQTLFTTVTVTKSSLEKKNASFSLSLKKEQIEVTRGSSHNRRFTEILGFFFFNTIIQSVRNTHRLLKKKKRKKERKRKEEARQELSHLSKSSWVPPTGSTAEGPDISCRSPACSDYRWSYKVV
jgi:hypothetical protein